jgi:transposase
MSTSSTATRRASSRSSCGQLLDGRRVRDRDEPERRAQERRGMHGRRAGPDDERLGRELAQRVDAGIAKQPTIRQLTVPGIGMITVAVFLAQTGTARGDINRFTSSQRLVGYLALDLRVRQSGNGPVTPAHQQRRRRRRPTRPRRSGTDRDPLLRPLRAFYQRIRARRGHPIAIVATARKLAKLFWHLLIREQDYAYTLPTPLAKKIRTIELRAGYPRRQPGGPRVATSQEQRRAIERQIAQHAQAAYEQTSPAGNHTPGPARDRRPRGLEFSSVPA